MQGWLMRMIGKGQKECEVPLPADVVGELFQAFVQQHLLGSARATRSAKKSVWSFIHVAVNNGFNRYELAL